MLYIARGIEDDHYWVVQELDGALVETPWRVEREAGSYRLSHADDSRETVRGLALGEFATPESAVEALRSLLQL
ncbi:hypothetical protein [Microbacterium sp. BH-3-3-3]|uniref:hypothetical protein n=1 Tax=Microbacterium sp. BH-3-3-3 TaxID=1906742 RepID=UPI0012EAA728|nr:hypothetical protein [Microbacterium sp. BH-3-3-3]